MTEMLFPVVLRVAADRTMTLVDLREEARHAAIDGARSYDWWVAVNRAELHGGKPEDYVSWAGPYPMPSS